MKKCIKCNIIKEDNLFNLNIIRKDGLQSYCKLCCKLINKLSFQKKVLKRASLEAIDINCKKCTICKNIKNKSEFFKNKSALDKLQTCCKHCAFTS